MTHTRASTIAAAIAAGIIGTTLLMAATPSGATLGRPRRTTTTAASRTTTTAPATAGPTAPTNLRVTALTATSVTFQWDHSMGATGGCTLPIILYYLYVDGTYRGSTYLGSPVGFVAGLQPGGTYTLTVAGRDNCSGRTSPMSAPLVVSTPT